VSAVARAARQVAARGRPASRSKRALREVVQVGVQFATGRRGVPQSGSFKRWANAAVAAAALPGASRSEWSVSVRVVGSAESRKLNRLWRGKDKPTNVLSFPSDVLNSDAQAPSGSTDEPQSLGDLAICAPVVAREAKEQQKVLQAHWAHMVIHGILHLLGYDHEDDRDAERMESCEIAILAQFGYPNPYV
jgi:probable rRNA maturation factor